MKKILFSFTILVLLSLMLSGCEQLETSLSQDELEAEAEILAEEESIGTEEAKNLVGEAWRQSRLMTRIIYLGCSDSDGGNNPEKAGKTTVKYTYRGRTSSKTYADKCIEGQTLTEYYCEGKKMARTKAICKFGCKDGACMSIPDCSHLKCPGAYWDEELQQCVCPLSEVTCTDTDGGRNIYEKGSLTVEINGEMVTAFDICAYDNVPNDPTSVRYIQNLSCSAGSDCYVHEGDCKGYDLPDDYFEPINCPYGCFDGACLALECNDFTNRGDNEIELNVPVVSGEASFSVLAGDGIQFTNFGGADADERLVIVKGKNPTLFYNASMDEYFIVSGEDSKKSYLLEVTDIDDQDGVDFKNVVNGIKYENKKIGESVVLGEALIKVISFDEAADMVTLGVYNYMDRVYTKDGREIRIPLEPGFPTANYKTVIYETDGSYTYYYFAWEDGKATIDCNRVPAPVEEKKCKDSDGGKNYYVKGTTTGPQGENIVTKTDSCLNSYQVGEWFCWPSDNHVEGTTYTCPSGCKDGACIKEIVEEKLFYRADWDCYDSYNIAASHKIPMSSEAWQDQAEEFCKGRCNEIGKCGATAWRVY